MSSYFVHHLPVHRKIIVKFSIIRIFDIAQVMHALKFVSVNFMFERIALMWPIAMANMLASLLKCDLIHAHNQHGSGKKEISSNTRFCSPSAIQFEYTAWTVFTSVL